MSHRPPAVQPRDESGFTLVTVIAVMAVVMLFSLAALATVNGDVLGSGEDVTSKQAENGAEVGIADFSAQLARDSSSWTKCTGGGTALNDPWTGRTPPGTTKWATVPGTTSRYSIELLPARKSGYSKCTTDPAKVAASMIDGATRGLRIRVTGQATGAKGTEQRSVIATFRRTSFLDYLYFTDYEAADPIWMVRQTGGNATQPATASDGDLMTWAANNCVRYYRPAPVGLPSAGYNRPGFGWKGKIDTNGNGSFLDETTKTYNCDSILRIQFAGFDKLLGPMHTNDEFLMCNGFTAGRSTNDRIESGRSWRPCDGLAATQPTMTGTLVQNAPRVDLPPTDASLATVATGYTYTGTTTIQLQSTGQIKVINAGLSGGSVTIDPPPNGVIYIKNGATACGPYQPLNPYLGTAANPNGNGISSSCGDAWVSGTYSSDLTIAAANDVIVNGDVISKDASDARLGLIADNFVRVYHPVVRTTLNDQDCNEPASPIAGRRIDAAILSLQHSFMVDNYYCGSAIGTLTINGIIAQKFRGAVGTPNGSVTGDPTGFAKNYNYDERLAYKGPPHFLDPVRAAWKMSGFSEQQGTNPIEPTS
jgi:type II secretory pathway pseudopilin PulG